MIFWLASYPKSGNTWIRMFLRSYFLSSSQKFSLNEKGMHDFEVLNFPTPEKKYNIDITDDIIDTDKILNFFDANRIRVYFKGKYLYEFDMTYEQFNAFREILANYDYI